MVNREMLRLSRGPAIALIALLSLPSVFAKGEPAKARRTAQPRGGWVCNAYGYNRHWITVSGSWKKTKRDAENSAMLDCSKSLFVCEVSECWRD
jgi:hypothetical protein